MMITVKRATLPVTLALLLTACGGDQEAGGPALGGVAGEVLPELERAGEYRVVVGGLENHGVGADVEGESDGGADVAGPVPQALEHVDAPWGWGYPSAAMPAGRDPFGLKALALRVLYGDRRPERVCRVCRQPILFRRTVKGWRPVNGDGSEHLDRK